MRQGRRRGKCAQNFLCGNMRPTAARCSVLDVFNGTKEHLSADDIYLKLKKSNSNIGIATVYRTLDIMCLKGILNKYNTGDKAKYELSHKLQEKGHHHHLICSKCGAITDYTDFMEEEKEVVEKIEKKLSVKHNFKINNHRLDFYGLCGDCLSKQE